MWPWHWWLLKKTRMLWCACPVHVTFMLCFMLCHLCGRSLSCRWPRDLSNCYTAVYWMWVPSQTVMLFLTGRSFLYFRLSIAIKTRDFAIKTSLYRTPATHVAALWQNIAANYPFSAGDSSRLATHYRLCRRFVSYRDTLPALPAIRLVKRHHC